MVGTAPMCTNLYSDPANCGMCGNHCAAGLGCYSGTCGTAPPPPTCPASNEICTDPMGMKQYCSDPMYDSQNCGKCGIVCGSGMGCQQGVCVAQTTSTDAGAGVNCLQPSKTCQNAMGAFCANVMSDPSNCGNCGYTCPNGQSCQQGLCTAGGASDGGAINCPANFMACYPAAAGPYCANVMNDPNNCGACLKPCGGGMGCQNGVCTAAAGQDAGASMISCPAGQIACDNAYCTDLTSDPMNCGGCHVQCAGGCVNSACELP
jgi:hypothetical protein